MASLDGNATNVALPHIGLDFHATLQGLQWVGDAYALTGAALVLTAGACADRFGRKRMFQFGQVTFVLTSLLCFLAPNLGSLIGFRAVQGIAWSFLTPTSLSLLSGMYSDGRARAKAIGLWSATGGLGVVAGPILGGLLVNYFGWRSIFLINLPVGTLAILITRIYVVATDMERKRRLDPLGQAAATACLGVLTYALIEGPQKGWTSATILLLFGLAVGLAVVFITIEHKVIEPLLELSVFRIRSLTGACVAGLTSFAVLSGFFFITTLLLQDVRGLSPIRTGFAILPCTLMMTIFPRISGRLTGRYGPKLPVMISFCLFIAGEFGLFFSTGSTSLALLAIPFLLHGMGLGFMSPPLTVAAVAAMPPERAGVASGAIMTARQIGSVLGIALLGSIVTSQFYATLQRHLVANGLSARTAAHAAAVVRGGNFAATGLSVSVASAVHRAVLTSFVDGEHWANVAGILLLSIGFVVALKTLGGPVPISAAQQAVPPAVID
jgi:EmrB/QacA subfamily drug resistance transporter